MPDALETLKTAKKVVGCKQTRRAIQEGRASVLFLADDADPMLTAPLALEATMQGVEIVRAQLKWSDFQPPRPFRVSKSFCLPERSISRR